MKFYKSTDYWYGVYMHAVRPVILEKVESTDRDWDDKLLDAFDYIINRLIKPKDAAVSDQESY